MPAARINPAARVYETNSEVVALGDPALIKGKRVVTVDDGPTLTHGEAGWRVGWEWAEMLGVLGGVRCGM